MRYSLLLALSAGVVAPSLPAAPAFGCPPWLPFPNASLRQLGEARGVMVGTAASLAGLDEPPYAGLLAGQFDSLTPENAMKWQPIHPRPDEWNFDPADRLVLFAGRNGMRVKGHTLVWHNQVPDYLASLSEDDLRCAVREHIRTVVGRYRGRVYAWDVVNEALADGDGDLRPTLFLNRLGEGYIAEAFRAAHEADPDALLFYNDYGCDGLGRKSDRQFALLRDLRAAGVPVHGVGLQMHLTAKAVPRPQDVAANVRRLACLGLRVHVSEMDVRVRDVPGGLPVQLETQAAIYHDILAACLCERGFEAFTFWGFTDRHSWVHQTFGPDLPLPFDTLYRPKPAYVGVRAALLGW
jgi:endo-1,4-beta-xylanase